MTPLFVACPVCLGAGLAQPNAFTLWPSCPACDGVGRIWISGGPRFGCSQTLADREPGEIVTLGNGDRVRVQWHQPRKRKKADRPETTFVGPIDDFTGEESYAMVPIPSSVGVLSVDVSRAVVIDAHDHDRAEDINDPMQRTVAGRLI